MKKTILLGAIASSMIIGASSLYAADLDVEGTVNVTANPMPIGPTRTGYPAINMMAAGDTSVSWLLGTGTDTSDPGVNAVGFINPITGAGPFFIASDAVDELFVLSEESVMVGGDILAAWSGSNTVGDGLKNLITLSATNSDVGGSITSDAGFRLVNGNTSKGWNFRTNSGGDAFQATLQGTGGSEFTVTNATTDVSGTELYLGNGAKNVGGVWINASSRALKENIKPLSTKEALTAFNKLQPVTYNYKSDKKEQVVGFIAEDVPELVAIQSRDGLSSMDMVAVLTKVVQEQDKMLKVQAEKIAKLETMQKRLAKVESLLTNLALDTSKTTKEKISLK